MNIFVLAIGAVILYAFVGLVVYSISLKVVEDDVEFQSLMNGIFWPLTVIVVGLFLFGKKILFPPAQRLAEWIT